MFDKLLYVLLGVAITLFLSVVHKTGSSDGGELRDGAVGTEFTRRLGQGTFTNELIECQDTYAGVLGEEQLKSMRSETKGLIDERLREIDKINSVSVYFRDLNAGSWFGVDEDRQYVPASLLKVPTMIAFLKASYGGMDLLEQKVSLDRIYNVGGHLVDRQSRMKVGSNYTARELIEIMIRDSDNNAVTLLFEKVSGGISDLESIFADLGVPYSEESTGPITARQYSSFFRVLYNASYLDREDSEYALKLLSETNFDKALVAGVPSGIKVAHKFGERWLDPKDDKYFHDCGIIYYPKRPYLLCVMTKGQDFDYLVATVRNISGLIYERLSE